MFSLKNLACKRLRLHMHMCDHTLTINTLRPRQNGRRFADDTFKRIFLNENVRISIEISLKFVPKGPINNIPALVQIMAWRRSGDKPLSEPMMDSLLTHICVTRPQWVKQLGYIDLSHKSHDAPVPYPTMHRFVTEVYTCVHIALQFCIKLLINITSKFCRKINIDTGNNP